MSKKHRARKALWTLLFYALGCFLFLASVLLIGVYRFTLIHEVGEELAIQRIFFLAGIIGYVILYHLVKRYLKVLGMSKYLLKKRHGAKSLSTNTNLNIKIAFNKLRRFGVAVIVSLLQKLFTKVVLR